VKRRVVVVFLVAFAIWPALHRLLVAAYDANPWKLAGWAMYSRPHFPSQLALGLLEEGRVRPVELVAWERVLADEFLERYFSVGRLTSPDTLVQALLARFPDAEGVVVELRTPFLDPSSALLEERVERDTFRRSTTS
jgi:hypothetical protein